MNHLTVTALWLAARLGLGVDNAGAQDKAKEAPKPGWSNDADLSLVLTAGNSASQTWAFTDELRHAWKDARFEFEVNVVRANTSDDRWREAAAAGGRRRRPFGRRVAVRLAGHRAGCGGGHRRFHRRRPPAIAFAIAPANCADQRFGGAIILYLLLSLLIGVPYVRWNRSRVEQC
jgi:hypothetical protein